MSQETNAKLPPVWLAESLATHRRGRILKTTVNAQPVSDPPQASGLCLLFGADFQSTKKQQLWFEWSQVPGRTLLLIPPFKSAKCQVPTEWQASRRLNPAAMKSNRFLNSLAAEVQYEFQGQFQIPDRLGGTWDDDSLCTVYYRKHPHAGIFAMTCLPLWSLLVLDRAEALRAWVGELSGLAATSVEEVVLPRFEPQPEHFTVLLHLLTSFVNEAEALAALESSQIFMMDAVSAKTKLQDLQANELVDGVCLTKLGREALQRSPYAPYAEELEALR